MIAACVAIVLSACADDRVGLQRGPIGPASYVLGLAVDGTAVPRGEEVDAALDVHTHARGATLRLAVPGGDPVTAELRPNRAGELRLEAVQGVPPTSAGEADLAALMSQLDPPLPPGPVRIGESWAATRRIGTQTLQAELTSQLRLVRFLRVGGVDSAELSGTVTGWLRADDGTGNVLEGTVEGTTTIAWGLAPGRLSSSRTDLTWVIHDAGTLHVRTDLRPG